MVEQRSLTIVVTTYIPGDLLVRREVAYDCIESWRKGIKWDGPLNLVIADDGSDEQLEPWWPRGQVLFTEGHREGVGASLNRGFKAAFAMGDFCLQLVDDWYLRHPLFDLDVWSDVLVENEDIGCVRLGLASPSLRGGEIEMFRMDEEGQGGVWGVQFEPYAYVWAQRPALYHRRFYDAYGPFPEGITAYEVDRIYNETVTSKWGPRVVLAVPRPWEHIKTRSLAAEEP